MIDKEQTKITRRDFLKLSAVEIGVFALSPLTKLYKQEKLNPLGYLGRITVGKVDLKARPDIDSNTVEVLYQNTVVPWLREVVGPNPFRINQRWIETPDGYAWAPVVQPVKNLPNLPLEELPDSSLGPGMWVEVSVPYVDLIQENPPARAPWLINRINNGMESSLVLQPDRLG